MNHMRIKVFALVALLIAAPALAQDDPGRGSLWLNYNLENALPGADHYAGFGLEVDGTVQGTPLSIVGHVSRNSNSMSHVTYAALGPRITKDFGALKVFGHYLYGSASIGVDDSATTKMDAVDMVMLRGGGLMPMSGMDPNNHRRGGGIMIPFGNGGEVRVSADHDGKNLYSVVGIGWRF